MPNIGRNASAKSIAVLKVIEPPHSVSTNDEIRITDGIEMMNVVTWKNPVSVVPMPVRNMWWAQTTIDMPPMNSTARDHQPVAPQRPPRIRRDHFGDDAHRRQDQDVDLGMSEKPEQVLPQQRIAAAGNALQRHAADDETARQEEARAGMAIHQLEDGRRLQRRECEQQQQRRHQLRPHEEGQLRPT